MPGARPVKYKPEYIDHLDKYMKACKPKWDKELEIWTVKGDEVPSVGGFRLWLKSKGITISASSLNHWKAKDLEQIDAKSEESSWYRFDEFLQMLEDLKELQAQTMLNGGASGRLNSNICKLVLAKHGYVERKDVTSGGESIKPTVNIGVDDKS